MRALNKIYIYSIRVVVTIRSVGKRPCDGYGQVQQQHRIATIQQYYCRSTCRVLPAKIITRRATDRASSTCTQTHINANYKLQHRVYALLGCASQTANNAAAVIVLESSIYFETITYTPVLHLYSGLTDPFSMSRSPGIIPSSSPKDSGACIITPPRPRQARAPGHRQQLLQEQCSVAPPATRCQQPNHKRMQNACPIAV